MLTKLIIHFGLRNKPVFITTIAKIEYGVAIFCRKLASQVEELGDNYSYLSQLLKCQANDEIKHGKMLSSLVEKINLQANGQCLTKFRPATQEYIISPPQVQSASNTVFIEWDSIGFPGEKIQAIYENFDGISKRYLSARLLFEGKSADSFDLIDQLAFMHVLEEETQKFYIILAELTQQTSLGAIASQIAADEKHHADYLKSKIDHFIPFSQNIEKWRRKVMKAKWAVPIDLWLLILGIIAKNLRNPDAKNY